MHFSGSFTCDDDTLACSTTCLSAALTECDFEFLGHIGSVLWQISESPVGSGDEGQLDEQGEDGWASLELFTSFASIGTGVALRASVSAFSLSTLMGTSTLSVTHTDSVTLISEHDMSLTQGSGQVSIGFVSTLTLTSTLTSGGRGFDKGSVYLTSGSSTRCSHLGGCSSVLMISKMK